ncbi:thiamine diphosphokinase [Virgibacillus phasianinus]|uniref:Thiamine diphosphokinase n=1 Tax=Virgibacillus phasianinus TaxID=2017483 RepID=A0A220U6S4_9BACI|nr:thiamine diphosphokinase [Virgibacillus phasianinus]ASK63541.1 thiamine diphosphokinase [Virgibacillus phasianinus]
MTTIGIVANGPEELIPSLKHYQDNVDVWIGADRGSLTLLSNQIRPDYALGDFDSINQQEQIRIEKESKYFLKFNVEKDQTDLEIAIDKALELKGERIYFFGVTGGRLDHGLVNIQSLYVLLKQECSGIIIDKSNCVELFTPGSYRINSEKEFPNISFVPFSQHVSGLSLKGFYYPLQNYNLTWGSTRCISNKLLLNNGTFSFDKGILLLIKSRDG